MTTATLYRRPRRMFRKLIKPAALWLNAWRYRYSEFELARLRSVGNIPAATRQHARQMKLMMQRHQIGGW